jgi:hypothetical protein
MTKVYVAEFAGLAATAQGDSVAVVAVPPLNETVLDTGSGETHFTLGATTVFIELSADGIASFVSGPAAVATTANARITTVDRILRRVNPGDQVSAITNT